MQQLKGSYDAKRLRIVATTRDVDRDGEVVDPRGVTNLDSYLKTNPVILWQHRHAEAPIGKATDARLYDDRIELDVEWAPTALGQEVKALYDGGFMSAFSIGFLPKSSETIDGQFTWTQWELMETSAVSIPANPMATAIRSAEAAGYQLPALKSATNTGENTMEDRNITSEQLSDDELAMIKQNRREREMRAQTRAIRPSEQDDLEIRLGMNPDYDGVNLRKGAKAFSQARARAGDEAGAARALADEDQTMHLIRSMHDMATAADRMPYARKDLVRGTGEAGGFLTSEDRDSLLAYARKNSVILSYGRTVRMTDNQMVIPREDGKLELGFTNEATEAGQTSATFEEVTLTAQDLDGYADVSMHLEMDSDTPIAALLLDQFVEAYGQKIDSAGFVSTGDPVSGLFVGGLGASEVFDSGSTAFSEIVAANLFGAVSKVPIERRRNARWLLGTTPLWSYLAQMQSGDTYLMSGNWSQGPDTRLLGFPVSEVPYAPADAAETVMAVFGDLKGFTVGDRLSSMMLFRDPYSMSAKHWVRYVFWTRVAFARTLPGQFCTIQTAAS